MEILPKQNQTNFKYTYVDTMHEQNSSAVTTGASVTFFSFIVPVKCFAKAKAFGNYLGDASYWGYVTWSVLRNGTPVSPLNAVKDQIGLQFQPLYLDVNIEFMGGQEISVKATNAGPGTCNIGNIFIFDLYRKIR